VLATFGFGSRVADGEMGERTEMGGVNGRGSGGRQAHAAESAAELTNLLAPAPSFSRSLLPRVIETRSNITCIS
jgi:hypothetical protein